MARSFFVSFVSLVSFALFVSFVAGAQPFDRVGAAPSAVEGQQPTAPATEAQQKPVFRGGTHFVRVDAYPTTKDGHIVEGLKPEDFEITEDGKPQTIESFDYISFPTFTPDAERHDPDSQRDGFALAADPRYRVFVIVVDVHFSPTPTARKDDLRLWNMQQPLTEFLDRVIGPNDLFGFLTTRNSGKDLVLAQKTTAVEAQLAKLWESSMMEYDSDVYQLQQKCGSAGVQLAGRLRSDRTYTSLESLVAELGSLRDERKSVIFVADNLTRDKPSQALAQLNGKDFPHAGIVDGRVGIGDDAVTGGNDQYCIGEMKRLGSMDFEDRYKDLLRSARSANVTFYPIAPSGVPVPTPSVSGVDAAHRAEDSLVTLANQTDGVPFVANDLARTVGRLVDDLAAYYLLGYYTTNTTWDGGLRTIKVKLKASGDTIRARRQYRAPTRDEIDALVAKSPGGTPATAKAATDRETALAILERASRPFASYTALHGSTLSVVTELTATSIQSARWKSGADVLITASTTDGAAITMGRGRIEPGSYTTVVPLTIDPVKPPARISIDVTGAGERPANDWLNLPTQGGALVADPIAYRSASRIAPRPVAAFEFARNERIRVEWPILVQGLDRREARLLDHAGKPLPVELPLSEDPAKTVIALDTSLSGLPRGDYLFELTVGAGGATERHLLAIRIKP